MCELLAMSSLRATQLSLSLETLSSHSGSADNTRDGWGVAYYQGKDVALFREPRAASDSPLARYLESQGPSTTLAISHIRRATHGEVALANTQPFIRELAGNVHVFAHNGDLPGIEQSGIRVAEWYRPIGTTDSEHAFCALLERLRDAYAQSSRTPPLQQRLDIVAAFAADLRTLGPANFLYADGDTLFAHSHRRIQPATGSIAPPGLHILSRRRVQTQTDVDVGAVSIAPGLQEVVLVASVPLSDESWRPLAEGEVVAISSGQLRESIQRVRNAHS